MSSEEPLKSREFQNDNTVLGESLKTIITSALLEKFAEGDERPCNSSDFSETKRKREEITSEILISIKHFAQNSLSNDDIQNQLLALILILCGQNTVLHPWNTEVTVTNCKSILSETLKIFNCEEPSEFISKNVKVNLLKVLFQMLCPSLTSKTWKHFPAAVASYRWILEMIKQPDLSQYLQFVLPPALLLTDDYVNENRIIGIKCLNHIIQNTTIAELQFCGHGNVIYDVLIPLLRIRESDIISTVVSPLVSLTVKLEFDLGKKDRVKWSKFDDILECYLENMELEQLIDLRNCYISNLGSVVTATGFGIVKWSKRLLRIFREYIQTAVKINDDKTINLCVKIIEQFMALTSDCVTLYAENLLITLMIAVNYEKNSNFQKESKEKAIKCIELLLKSYSVSDRNQIKSIIHQKFPCDITFNV